jgi:hypothetical protein
MTARLQIEDCFCLGARGVTQANQQESQKANALRCDEILYRIQRPFFQLVFDLKAFLKLITKKQPLPLRLPKFKICSAENSRSYK